MSNGKTKDAHGPTRKSSRPSGQCDLSLLRIQHRRHLGGWIRICADTILSLVSGRIRTGDVERSLVIYQRLTFFRVFCSSTPNCESRRADSNRLPLLITSERSGVAEVCT